MTAASAVNRYAAAIAAGATPAHGTYHAAVAELDAIAADAWDALELVARNATDLALVAKSRQLLELVAQQRLAIAEHRAATQVVDALGRGLAAMTVEAAGGQPAAVHAPPACHRCGRLNPTLRLAGRPLCTRCADELHVRPHGKIGDDQ